MSARPCANPDCPSVIDAERVRRRPTIESCCPACKQAVHRLRKAERALSAGDVTTGRRRGGGPRGPSLPYRRTIDQLFAGNVGQILRAWFGDDVEAERTIRSDLYRAASETNRARIVRLEKERDGSTASDSRQRSHVSPEVQQMATPLGEAAGDPALAGPGRWRGSARGGSAER